jgi:hypothetical protein
MNSGKKDTIIIYKERKSKKDNLMREIKKNKIENIHQEIDKKRVFPHFHQKAKGRKILNGGGTEWGE